MHFDSALFLRKRLHLLRWAAWYSALTAILVALFALNFVRFMPDFDSWYQSAYVGTALLGHFSSIALLFLLAVTTLILIAPFRALIRALMVGLASLAAAAMVLDYQVYTQYRFHLNGVLLNLIIEDGGEEIFVFSWMTWLLSAAALLGVLLLQLALAKCIDRWIMPARRPYGVWLASLCFGSFIASHVTHIWADARYDRRITGLTRHIPFYYPTTAKSYLQERGWVDLDENRERAQAALKSGAETDRGLDYPKAPLSCQPTAATLPNVLLIVVDTWRYDELDEITSPVLFELERAAETLSFSQHFSGGNSTKSGIFSLFYGLPSSYWDAMSSGLTPPVLMTGFQDAGYQFGIFASAKLTRPAFDRNVFASIPDLRTESKGEHAWQKDQDVNREWFRFLDQRDTAKPFFGFLFYDATHAYTFPPDAVRPYDNVWERIDHLDLNEDFDPLPYLNRHKTSVRFVDGLIGEVLEQLKARGLYENTVVLVTSDHGEEFNDNGLNFWGHGGNYTRVQTQVPLLIHWPGKPSSRHDYRTSHMDLASTLLIEVLGCENPPSDYSIGRSLFNSEPRQWLYSGSYYNYAILLEDSILVTYPTGNYEFLGLDNRPLPDKRIDAKLSLDVLQALSRFYR